MSSAVEPASCCLLGVSCGNFEPDVSAEEGCGCGCAVAAWTVPCVRALWKPSGISKWQTLTGCRSAALGLAFAGCHGVFLAGSGNSGTDLAAGSGFVCGFFRAAWDVSCEQLPGTPWRTLMPSAWWMCGSRSQHSGLLNVCSHGVLAAAQRQPDPPVTVGRLSPAQSQAPWAGRCAQAAGNSVMSSPMLPGWRAWSPRSQAPWSCWMVPEPSRWQCRAQQARCWHWRL